MSLICDLLLEVKDEPWKGVDIMKGVDIQVDRGHIPGTPAYRQLGTNLPRGLPQEATYFKLVYTHIKSLEGSPQSVTHQVLLRGNRELKSLKGGPRSTGSFYYAHENDLHDLIGAPTHVGGDFTCHQNRNLSSIEGGPNWVKGDVKLNMNANLKSLEGIGTKYFCNVGGTLHVGKQVVRNALGLVLMNCKHFTLLFPGSEVLIEYCGKATKEQREEAAIDCQHALIEAGFKALAEL